ncbi:MAG: type II secretion system F family protein [Candidatus Omnitrophota bacterium]
MPIYKYTAKDESGKAIAGSIEATSQQELLNILHQKNLIILSCEEEKRAIKKEKANRVKLDDLVVFSRQLATLIDSGIPVVQALGILGEQVESKNLNKVTLGIRRSIEEGVSFHEALSKYPQVFSELYINMVKAGEASGMLDDVLERLATYLEKTSALIRKIKASMVYPVIVISMAIIITSILLLKVVPTFKGIFDVLGGSLPLPTQILIAVSDLMRKYILFLVGGINLFVFLFRHYAHTEKGKYNIDKRVLKLPIFGPLMRKIAVAKFSRTFSTLVKSGVPILNALDIVAKTSGNKVVEESITSARQSIREGEPISQPLGKSRVFPPMVVRMISVGEQTGELEKMLTKIADFYDEQVDAAISSLTSMIEPMVIAFLGIVIGGIVIALFLPIFKITELVAR